MRKLCALLLFLATAFSQKVVHQLKWMNKTGETICTNYDYSRMYVGGAWSEYLDGLIIFGGYNGQWQRWVVVWEPEYEECYALAQTNDYYYIYNSNGVTVVNNTAYVYHSYSMCYYDLESTANACPSAWRWSYYYDCTSELSPNQRYIYLLSDRRYTNTFDTRRSVDESPFVGGGSTTSQYYRWYYPGSGVWQDEETKEVQVFWIGGSYDTNAVECANVTGAAWGSFYECGTLNTNAWYSSMVTWDNLVFILGGYIDWYSMSTGIWVYDMTSYKSKHTQVYMDQGRSFSAAGAQPGYGLFIANGYIESGQYTGTVEKSNQMDYPTPNPTSAPSQPPTGSPSSPPTAFPTWQPNNEPTPAPTFSPTTAPTTPDPTPAPTRSPTANPTRSPTRSPVQPPTSAPSHSPVEPPSAAPTTSPTRNPTNNPTPYIDGEYTRRFEVIINSNQIDFDFFWSNAEEAVEIVIEGTRAALVDEMRYRSEILDFGADWQEHWIINDDNVAFEASEDENGDDVVLFVIEILTDEEVIDEVIEDLLTSAAELKDASSYLDNYLEDAFNENKLIAYMCYKDRCGIRRDTESPTKAPTKEGGGNLSEQADVTTQAWFLVLVIGGVLVLFFGTLIYFFRRAEKKDKKKRDAMHKAIAELANPTVDADIPMNVLTGIPQAQALTHSLWLGGGTGSEGTDGTGGGEGAGQHTQLLNNMLASKLQAQAMGMGMGPMGGGLAMGGMGMGGMGGMGMMNPMMGVSPFMMQQYQNPHSILGNINNYVANPAMFGQMSGMGMDDFARMVQFQNQSLVGADGNPINPMMLSTDALQGGGEAGEDVAGGMQGFNVNTLQMAGEDMEG